MAPASSYDMHPKKSATAAVSYYGNADMNNGNSGGTGGGSEMYNGAEYMAVAAAVAAQQQKQSSAGDLVSKNHQVRRSTYRKFVHVHCAYYLIFDISLIDV